MGTRILIKLLLCSIIFSSISAEEKFGFIGEFKQSVIKNFPIHNNKMKFEADNEILYSPKFLSAYQVKALMIGISTLKPDNPEYEIFDFWSYHWPGHSEWWVGFIVCNYGEKAVPVKTIMELAGPKKSKIQRNAILQPDEATLFKAKVNLASQIGLYTLTGKITGAGISSGNTVITRFYIYDIW
jgi:hypothetical protein